MNRREFTKSAGLLAGSILLGNSPVFAGKESSEMLSASAMAFAPDGKLVVADWRKDQLLAYEIPLIGKASGLPFRVMDLAGKSSELKAVRATALAYRTSDGLAVVAMAGEEGAVELVGFSAEGERIHLPTKPAQTIDLGSGVGDGTLWRDKPVRSLTITDLQFFKGDLYLSGISNADFSSVLRKFAYPFDGNGATADVEMYHAVHNQWETRAPIRAFSIVELESEPFVVAAYTCTPLVTFPLSALKNGAQIKGKTVAELGFGNTPLSVIPFQIDYEGNQSSWVLVANSAKSGDLISLEALQKANEGPGLTGPVKPPFQASEGLPAIPLPLANLVKMTDQNAQFFLALRRVPDSGELQLVSYRKGAFFRLSDFVNEYDFPNYEYPPSDTFQQTHIRPFHGMMRTEEGYPDLVK